MLNLIRTYIPTTDFSNNLALALKILGHLDLAFGVFVLANSIALVNLTFRSGYHVLVEIYGSSL
eukprot:snap_masked-scaffold_5-processed-gene-10.12-mRNA-1 protein AED:1.00 eAED:1.00 QI:0/0/0/0/1/1/2/0/63